MYICAINQMPVKPQLKYVIINICLHNVRFGDYFGYYFNEKQPLALITYVEYLVLRSFCRHPNDRPSKCRHPKKRECR